MVSSVTAIEPIPGSELLCDGDGKKVISAIELMTIMNHHLPDLVIMTMIFIEGELVMDPKPDQQCNGHPYGQASHIDNGRGSILEQVAPSDLEIVFKHRSFL